MAVDTKTYLEYLDKEMTIMGILSAVAVVAPAGILNALLGEKSYFKEQLWGAGPFFVIVGSMFCILAGLLFYKERSLLAWYYGQLCLIESLDDGDSIPAKLRRYMDGADSWETWIPYSLGFTALVAGLVEYASAAFYVLAGPNSCVATVAWVTGRVFPLLAIAFTVLQCYVYKHYSYRDDLWSDFRSDVIHLFRTQFPHDGVYARLKTSVISGVGVFAITKIPKGTYIFEPDDDRLVSFSVLKIDKLSLPPSLLQLYEDFCVRKGETYECPPSFNKLTPSWYLNMSKDNPNVAADLSLKFYAIREIEDGEELTVDYGAYSDNKFTVPKADKQ